MSAHDVVNEFRPETDPTRRGWQVLLGAAWAVRPNAGVDELAEWAIRFAGRSAVVDRRLVEEIALNMALERGQVAS